MDAQEFSLLKFLVTQGQVEENLTLKWNHQIE